MFLQLIKRINRLNYEKGFNFISTTEEEFWSSKSILTKFESFLTTSKLTQLYTH